MDIADATVKSLWAYGGESQTEVTLDEDLCGSDFIEKLACFTSSVGLEPLINKLGEETRVRLDIVDLDRELYDVDGALVDLNYGNYGGDPEDYLHTNRILNSITNGQFHQAREIFDKDCKDFDRIIEAAKERGMDPMDIHRILK